MLSRLIMLFCVVVLSNMYVCYKYEEFLALLNICFSHWVFRSAYSAVVLLFFASIFFQDALLKYEIAETAVTYIVTIYLGLFMLSLTLFLCFDAVFLVGRFFPRLLFAARMLYAGGLTVMLISIAVTGYGMWNARQFSVKKYEITVAKTTSVDSIRLVFLGDIHLGTSVREKELYRIVSMVNALSPDVVAIGGDFYDHSTTAGLKKAGAEIISLLKARYGVYYVFGNHEYYLGDVYQATEAARAVTRLLDDTYELVGDAFYLVGRNDPTDRERKKTPDIVKGLDMSKPVIMIEHQPNDIEANIASGIDLQFSGHTHRGQVFPFNVLVKIFNGLFYGHYRFDGYQAVVTSGTGTWRFPIRVGSKNEIVYADIYFGDRSR